MFDQGEQKEENEEDACFILVIKWIFQIFFWAFIIYLSLSINSNLKSKDKDYIAIFIYSALLIAAYISYVVLELKNSSKFKYLCNKITDEGMYQKMRTYFSTKPELSLKCESYHMEERTTTDERGSNTTYVKVVTYSESLSFPYYSGRDVSGLFYLNCDKGIIEKKKYLKLELIVDVNFADAVSYMDYENVKNNLIKRNKLRDKEIKCYEINTIPGMKNLNLIKLGDSGACCSNCCCFVFFTLLTLAEPYKLYFNSLCFYQKYKIRKLVSTRYDLTQPEFEEKYQKLNPQINLINRSFSFESKEYNYLNNDYQVKLPTQEEIQNAEKYKDKIPEYKVSTKGDIIDSPESGYDNNNPAPIILDENNIDGYNILEDDDNDNNNDNINNNNSVELPKIKKNSNNINN